jgi:hypothetical protein
MFRPTHIVHLAGVSSPVEAALDRRRTWAVNVGVARILADYVAATDGWMLYPSSDFIWDGTAEARYCEEDVPEPRTVYGHSKVAAERVVLDAGAGAVARFSLMYGMPRCPRDSTWVRIMAALQQGDVRIRFAADECQVVEDGAFILVLPEGRELVGVVRRWRDGNAELASSPSGGISATCVQCFLNHSYGRIFLDLPASLRPGGSGARRAGPGRNGCEPSPAT